MPRELEIFTPKEMGALGKMKGHFDVAGSTDHDRLLTATIKLDHDAGRYPGVSGPRMNNRQRVGELDAYRAGMTQWIELGGDPIHMGIYLNSCVSWLMEINKARRP